LVILPFDRISRNCSSTAAKEGRSGLISGMCLLSLLIDVLTFHDRFMHRIRHGLYL
jgi:hypothetical protein